MSSTGVKTVMEVEKPARGGKRRTCCRLMFFLWNLLCLLLGLGLVTLGCFCVAARDVREFGEVLGPRVFLAVGATILVVGLIVTVISLIGCWGALRENACLLRTYAAILICLLLLQITAGILAFVFRDRTQDTLQTAAWKTISEYSEDESLRLAWNKTQRALSCCGYESAADWTHVPGSPFYERIERPVFPDQCCRRRYAYGCSEDSAIFPFPDGCRYGLERELAKWGTRLGVAALITGLAQVTGVVTALCLVT